MNDDEYFVRPTTILPGRVVSVMRLTYGRARITIGPDDQVYDDDW